MAPPFHLPRIRPLPGQESEAVIGRAILDDELRMALFADPHSALAGYELTGAELTALKSVNAENLDACAGSLGRRILGALTMADRNATAQVGGEGRCGGAGLSEGSCW